MKLKRTAFKENLLIHPKLLNWKPISISFDILSFSKKNTTVQNLPNTIK